MSQLADLLKRFYKQSSYRSVAALARSAQSHTAISESYIKQLMRGIRERPAHDKVIAIANALDLSREDTNALLKASGLPPLPATDFEEVTPQMQRMLDALVQLRQTPGVPADTFEMIADGFVNMVNGVRMAFGGEATGSVSRVVESGVVLRTLPAASLTPEEGMLDDLLGDLLSRSDDDPVTDLFAALEQAAEAERWETKRRITEALPRLVQMQTEATFRIASVLRDDYHPDYRADIRRRVVEAVPALYDYRPETSLMLLALREHDEVYVGMAILEALHTMEENGVITADIVREYSSGLQFDEPLHTEVIAFLNELLDMVRNKPKAALDRMISRRDDPERLIKIVIQRTAPRLLPQFPSDVLDLMVFFLRWNDDGFPVEHQNIRRPVSRALPEIIDLLPDAPEAVREQVARILHYLAQDPDIHVRRAFGDALDRLAVADADLAVEMMDMLIQDQDPYVRQRTWHALLQLSDRNPDKAEAYYMKLLTLAA